MTRRIFGFGILLAIAAVMVAFYRPFFATQQATPNNGFQLADLVADADEAAFDGIEHPWKFRFPADHGRHPGQRTETWQLSGVLSAAPGRKLGLQLVVARIALAPPAPERDSGWDSGEIYAGRLSISDPLDFGLLSSRRLSRGGIGLADWQAGPLRLWIEDWSIRQLGSRDRAPDLELEFAAQGVGLSLQLHDRQGLVTANDVSGAGGGGRPPFVYYVQPRLSASGELRRAGRVTEVSGILSIEHAWGELPLPGGPVVRDRFSLYLDDGRVVLLVRSHRSDGSGNPANFGLVAHADGRVKALGDADIELEPLTDRSGEAGRTDFPRRWNLRLPGEALDLELVIDGLADKNGAGIPALSGALRLEPRSGPLAGTGFAQLEGYRQ